MKTSVVNQRKYWLTKIPAHLPIVKKERAFKAVARDDDACTCSDYVLKSDVWQVTKTIVEK